MTADGGRAGTATGRVNLGNGTMDGGSAGTATGRLNLGNWGGRAGTATGRINLGIGEEMLNLLTVLGRPTQVT